MLHLLTACALLAGAGAYNLDVEHATVFGDPTGRSGSYFGLTVSLVKESGLAGGAWLLAGAPRGNSTQPRLNKIKEPGVVYQCKLERNSKVCLPLVLDSSGNDRVPSANGFSYMDKKDHAWIGGAMGVQNNGNGRIVVCGPRWKNQVHHGFYLMNGVCYWLSGTKDFGYDARKLIPLLRTNHQGYELDDIYDPDRNINEVFYYAYGGAGMSVDFVKNSTEMIIGAPGVFDWMGTVIRYQDDNFRFVNGDGELTELSLAGAYSNVLVPNPYKTKEITSSSYFGYSVGSGRFFRSSGTQYVGGAPRAGLLKGKVFIFDFPLSEDEPLLIKVELIGSQMGEYFGSSVCVVDLNADGLDDLIVGAPQYSLKNSGTLQQTGDEGRVYVFINEDKGRMIEIGDLVKIMGSQQHGARFGTSISNVGDLNNDGFPDIAVGAPYENLGSGAVYIYHGKINGINPKFVQRISALQIDHSIMGFGMSITKGLDIDANHYNDIAVGAYASGHAVLLKSRPVIAFHSKLESNVAKINFNATGFVARACLLYTGNYAPASLEVAITLKADPNYGRANFVTKSEKNSTLTFYQELKHVAEYCEEFEVEITSTYQDFTKPIDIRMDYNLLDSKLEEPSIPSNHRERQKRNVQGPFCKSCPVVDPTAPSHVIHRIPYATGCGEDDICKTEIKTEAILLNIESPFVIGSAPYIMMKVVISNTGDPAFLAETKVILPSIVPLVRIPQNCQEAPSSADSVSEVVLQCEIGNPLPKNESRDLFLEFDATNIPPGSETLRFKLISSSVGEEMSKGDNEQEIIIPLRTVADLSITGKSSQFQFYLPKQTEVGFNKFFSFSHVYEIRNYGPSPVEQVRLIFKFPTMVDTATGYKPFMRVYHPEASLDSKPFICTAEGAEFYADSKGEEQGSSNELTIPTSSPEYLDEERSDRYERSIQRNGDISRGSVPYSASVPSNRTVFANCTLPGEGCMTVTCITGPFKSPHTRALLIFPIKVDSKYFGPLLEKKDIILISSTGTVSNFGFPDLIQPDIHKPDYADAYTMFLGKLTESTVDSWIIALAIAGGIMTLLLIVLGLVKLGFFKRGKKDELDALKCKAEIEKSFAEDYD